MPAHYREAAQAALDSAWDRAIKHYANDKRLGTKPKLAFDIRGQTTLGRCFLRQRVIDINPVFLSCSITELVEDMIEVTIPHEVAHQVAWDLHKDRGHGPQWRAVMEDCYGLPPDRLATIPKVDFASEKDRMILDAFNNAAFEGDTE